MSPRRSPRLECLTKTTLGPQGAVHAPPRTAVGEPKDAARQGVLSSLRSDPQTGDGRYPVAWLHIAAPGRGTIPTATSKCACGRDRSAVGHRRVQDLIADHEAHKDTCPLRAPEAGRNTA